MAAWALRFRRQRRVRFERETRHELLCSITRPHDGHRCGCQEDAMLWALIVILLILWLLGFLVIPVGNALIHALLVIALVILIYQLVTGRRTL
jgi:hypothetical protein